MGEGIMWLVDAVTDLLDPTERGVVLGDLAESGEPAGEALRDVLGLVARRQMMAFVERESWLGSGILLAAAIILGSLGRRVANTSSVRMTGCGDLKDPASTTTTARPVLARRPTHAILACA